MTAEQFREAQRVYPLLVVRARLLFLTRACPLPL